jgi:hypothetical protein
MSISIFNNPRIVQRIRLAAEQAEYIAPHVGITGDYFEAVDVWLVGRRHIRIMVIGTSTSGDAVGIGCIEIAFRDADSLKLNPFDLISQ